MERRVIPMCGGVLIAWRDGAPLLLLGKRAAGRRSYPGVWDVIGGHVERGETAEQALVRELSEEIGVRPLAWREVGRFGAEPSEVGGEGLEFWLYVVTEWAGTPRNLQPEEHERIAWFGLEEACGLDLADPRYPALFRRMVTAPG